MAAVACLCMAMTGCALFSAPTYPTATERFFVNDYADILTDSDEQAVYQAGVALQQATDAQVVLVTVDSLDGQELEDYAIGLARDWGIGDADKDNGVLLLFTTDGPHTRVEVGYGLEGALPDSKAGRILDTYLVPWYGDDTVWSKRLTDTYTALINEVYVEYGLSDSQLPLDTPMPEEIVLEDAGALAMLLPLLLILVFCCTGIRRSVLFGVPFVGVHHRGGFHGGGFHGGGFRGGGGFGGGGGGFGGGGASR